MTTSNAREKQNGQMKKDRVDRLKQEQEMVWIKETEEV